MRLSMTLSMRGGVCGQAATLIRGYSERALGEAGGRVTVRTMRTRIPKLLQSKR
jgi:hypothetical protein